jgi:hypothetical protein
MKGRRARKSTGGARFRGEIEAKLMGARSARRAKELNRR